MSANLTQYYGQPAMIGDGAGFLRGTASGNGSTSTTGAPRIDLAPPTANSASGPNLPPPSPGPRSAFYLCLHDLETGLYDFLLQDDFVDIVPLPNASSRIRWANSWMSIPVTTTTGDAIILVATIPSQKPLNVIVTISGGSATVASWVNTAGTLTLTCGSTCTIATAVTYINANATTTTVTTFKAYGVGTLTDVMTGSAASAGLFIGPGIGAGFSGIGVSQASSAILPSTTAGDGIAFTAIPTGAAGNGIVVDFVTSTGTTSIVGNTVTLYVGSYTTNAAAAAQIVAAQVSAGIYLVSPSVVKGAADTTIVGSVVLSGGGTCEASLVGQVDPLACLHNGLVRPVQQLQALTVANLNYFHFKLLWTEGGTPTDQAGYGTLFIPSTTRGDGIVITSGASAPTAATLSVTSTTAGSGIKFTAIPLGAQGNQIGVVFNGPYSGYFLPSTTAGSGVQFTAYGVGPLYNAVTIFVTAPSGVTTFVSVAQGGQAITIRPKTGETNTGIVAAVAANAQAALLVTGATVGTASDVVAAAGNAAPVALSGGNSNASSVATISVVPNGQWSTQGGPGQTIVVQFGAGTTNAQVITAINASTPAAALVTVAEINVTTDPVVTTPLAYLTGGSSPIDNTVQFAGPNSGTLNTAVTLSGSGTATSLVINAVTAANANALVAGLGGSIAGHLTFMDSTGATETIAYATSSIATAVVTFSTITGGTDNMVIPVGTVFYQALPFAAMSTNTTTGGVNTLVSLGATNTNNTCANVCYAINEANSLATPTILAAPISSTTDVFVSGLIVPQTQLALADLMSFLLVLKDQANSLP